MFSGVEKFSDPIWDQLKKEVYAELNKHAEPIDSNIKGSVAFIGLEDALKQLSKLEDTLKELSTKIKKDSKPCNIK